MADAGPGTRGTRVPPARLAEPPLCLQGPSMLQAIAVNTKDNWLLVHANPLAGAARTRRPIQGGWNPDKRVSGLLSNHCKMLNGVIKKERCFHEFIYEACQRL